MDKEEQKNMEKEDNMEVDMVYDDNQHNNILPIDDENLFSDEEGDTSSESEGEEMITDGDMDCSGCLLEVKGNTWEELYLLYKQHSRAIGFGVRKSTTRRQGPDGIVCEKYFVCSCEGSMNSGKKKSCMVEESNDVEQKIRKQRRVPRTRTGCKASLRVKLNSDGVYEVVKHIVSHNHTLTPSQWQHHHRSERAIPPGEGEVIKIMTEARVPPTIQYRYMSATCGDEKLVGHTKKDHLNYVNRLKMKKLAGGDAQNVLEMLIKRASEEPGFFYSVKLDSKSRIQNLFWRDAMMKEDYLLYHDVKIFDTTYRTNRYNLICGAFVGINNHWSTVMFGCAFISDETTESFEWLFNTFNESMGGDVFPTTIFTDQDQAMSNAIEKVYPMSRHRLCQWHIQQNAISHFGTLKHDATFQHVFNKCLKGCFSETEFEETWDRMISEYGLTGNQWFKRLYGIRKKWSTAYSKDFFSAGILSSQRSESTNHAIGFQAKKTTSLTDFYGIFNDTVKRWRSEEEKNEFQCSRSQPVSNMHMMGLVKSAANNYTINLFQRFEQEFLYSLSTKAVPMGSEDTTMMYKVHPEESHELPHVVVFDSASLLISCSCKKFEECGLLCFHSLRVMHLHSVTNIPEMYITKRWSKYAKAKVWERLRNKNSVTNIANDTMNWRSEMLTKCHNLILRCNAKEEGRALFNQSYLRLTQDVTTLFGRESLSQNCDADASGSTTITTTVLDPARCTTKGRSARIKRPSKANKKKIQASSDSAVVGNVVAYTPTPRLI